MDVPGIELGQADHDGPLDEHVYDVINDGAGTSPVQPREEIEEIGTMSNAPETDAQQTELLIVDTVPGQEREVATTKRRRSERIRRPAANTWTPYTRGMG